MDVSHQGFANIAYLCHNHHVQQVAAPVTRVVTMVVIREHELDHRKHLRKLEALK